LPMIIFSVAALASMGLVAYLLKKPRADPVEADASDEESGVSRRDGKGKGGRRRLLEGDEDEDADDGIGEVSEELRAWLLEVAHVPESKLERLTADLAKHFVFDVETLRRSVGGLDQAIPRGALKAISRAIESEGGAPEEGDGGAPEEGYGVGAAEEAAEAAEAAERDTVGAEAAGVESGAAENGTPGRRKRRNAGVQCKFMWGGERCEFSLPKDLGQPETVQAFVKDLSKRGSAMLGLTIKPSCVLPLTLTPLLASATLCTPFPLAIRAP
jgi:hypothetical protein